MSSRYSLLAAVVLLVTCAAFSVCADDSDAAGGSIIISGDHVLDADETFPDGSVIEVKSDAKIDVGSYSLNFGSSSKVTFDGSVSFVFDGGSIIRGASTIVSGVYLALPDCSVSEKYTADGTVTVTGVYAGGSYTTTVSTGAQGRVTASSDESVLVATAGADGVLLSYSSPFSGTGYIDIISLLMGGGEFDLKISFTDLSVTLNSYSADGGYLGYTSYAFTSSGESGSYALALSRSSTGAVQFDLSVDSFLVSSYSARTDALMTFGSTEVKDDGVRIGPGDRYTELFAIDEAYLSGKIGDKSAFAIAVSGIELGLTLVLDDGDFSMFEISVTADSMSVSGSTEDQNILEDLSVEIGVESDATNFDIGFTDYSTRTRYELASPAFTLSKLELNDDLTLDLQLEKGDVTMVRTCTDGTVTNITVSDTTLTITRMNLMNLLNTLSTYGSLNISDIIDSCNSIALDSSSLVSSTTGVSDDFTASVLDATIGHSEDGDVLIKTSVDSIEGALILEGVQVAIESGKLSMNMTLDGSISSLVGILLGGATDPGDVSADTVLVSTGLTVEVPISGSSVRAAVSMKGLDSADVDAEFTMDVKLSYHEGVLTFNDVISGKGFCLAAGLYGAFGYTDDSGRILVSLSDVSGSFGFQVTSGSNGTVSLESVPTGTPELDVRYYGINVLFSSKNTGFTFDNVSVSVSGYDLLTDGLLALPSKAITGDFTATGGFNLKQDDCSLVYGTNYETSEALTDVTVSVGSFKAEYVKDTQMSVSMKNLHFSYNDGTGVVERTYDVLDVNMKNSSETSDDSAWQYVTVLFYLAAIICLLYLVHVAYVKNRSKDSIIGDR